MTTAANSTASPADEPVSDFERAIEACGFGIYNICLLFVALLSVTVSIFEVQTMSYILPTAECDLHLSLFDKGLLNGITYAGMILTALGWGFVADTVGRKWVLIYGLEINALCVLLSSLSQKLWQLLLFKFFGGCIACGPFAVVMSYLSESHGRKHRSRVMMAIGLLITTSSLILPTLASLILSKHIQFYFLGLKFHSWQIFLAITTLPAILSGILMTLFPESPKFLLSQGRNEEALQVFRRIYRLNTGNQEDTFPLKILRVEGHIDVVGESKKERFIHFYKHACHLLKIMFSHPFLWVTMRFYLMFISMMLSTNTVRLWLPQLFASFVQAEALGYPITSMCDLFNFNINQTTRTQDIHNENCDIHLSPGIYLNNIIVAAAALIGYTIAIILVRYIGNKPILNVCYVCSILCGLSLYWSTTDKSLLAIACIFMTSAAVSFTTATSVIVETFPTNIRTMVVIVAMTSGRVGALFGQITFPLLISWGCMPPFILIFLSSMCAFILSVTVPRATKASLN